MPRSQSELLYMANRLASNLAGPARVTRNAFLSIVADFLTSPRSDREKLRRTLKLLSEGSGGHLKRGDGYGQQIRNAVGELDQLLRDADFFSDAELKSVLGWTARLIQIRAEGLTQGYREVPRIDSSRSQLHPKDKKNVLRPVKSANEQASGLGSVGPKGLDVLKRLKEELEQSKESK